MKSNNAKLTAEICKCGENTVRMVLKGERNPDTKLGKKIVQVHAKLVAQDEKYEKQKANAKKEIAETAQK